MLLRITSTSTVTHHQVAVQLHIHMDRQVEDILAQIRVDLVEGIQDDLVEDIQVDQQAVDIRVDMQAEVAFPADRQLQATS